MPPKPKVALAAASKGSKPAAGGTGRAKAPAKPRQPLPVPERLKRLYTSLCAQIDGGHFSNAVKTCDNILRLSPSDKDAAQTKLFLLLQTEQYAAALAMVDGDGDASTHAYEKAYSLYRLQREAEAHEVLEALRAADADSTDDGRGAMHLEAQMAYRQGNYHAAADLYSELLDTADPDTEEHSDILTNLRAAQKHLDFITTSYLRAVDALPSTISSTLESAPPPVPASTSAAHSAHASTSASASAPAPAAKKPARAKRVPKGVVPGVTPAPDPERWTKKSERTTFVQRRTRGHKGPGGGGAAQGVAVDAPVGGGPVSGGGTGAQAGKGAKGKKKK